MIGMLDSCDFDINNIYVLFLVDNLNFKIIK